ncbi:MAG: hypothetical protein CL764_03040 [Chloroflexi bacterium]|nr:hypothetical protein [Chloroflexota bacterium]|tara:strand:+ start:703 stop:1437 length:735 start_codon:yes stop_codon:yes gene_type:complete
MIQGLLLDLDGTLINQNDEISFSVKNLVKKFAQKIPVSIISGRESREVKKFANELSLQYLQFSDNGARVIDNKNGKTIISVNIEEDLVKKLFTRILQEKLKFIATTNDKTFYTLIDIDSFDISTIVICLDGFKEAQSFSAEYSRELGLRVNVSSDSNREKYYVNFNHSHVSKGVAVNNFCRFYSLNKSKVMAIGDSYNDLDMLKESGIGVAMENAPIELKNVARYVVKDVNSDGVEEALLKFSH